jgi:DNA-binding winged helix-turn-helix (wHTH) protein/tetratricopeptide (TPR) repeat protein
MSAVLLRFGDFELDPSEHLLRRRGERVTLRPQAFRVLLLLAERSGTLVTRDELRRTAWPDEVVVDFEHGLNTCIRQVRAALEDQAERPRYLETVPRVGYRFIAAVETIEKGPVPPVSRRWTTAVVATSLLAIGVMVARYGAAPRQSPSSSDVAERYARGQMLLDGKTPASVRTALGVFEEIVALDPGYAAAHAGMAQAFLFRPSLIGGIEPAVALERGAHAVQRALALDASHPEAYSALAELRVRHFDWHGAVEALRRAVDLKPKSARIRAQFADVLALQGRFSEALIQARIGESLDPLSSSARHEVASVLRYARRYEDAMSQARRTLELDPNFGPAHFTVGHSLLALGRADEAIEAFTRSGRGPTGNLGHALALAGHTSEARQALTTLERQYEAAHVGEAAIAQVLIGLGEYDAAFEWLSRAVASGNGFTLKVADVWDPLRADPRFDELLRQVGLDR